MVAHDVFRVINHTTAIAGEQATGMNGLEITPRVDTVAAYGTTAACQSPAAKQHGWGTKDDPNRP